MKKKALHWLLLVSLSANAMVLVTWIIADAGGHDGIHPTYLFQNMVAAGAIVGVSTGFGWFYSRNISPLLMGSFHFLGTASTFVLCGLWARWFPWDGGIIFTSLLIFAGLFLVSWLFHYVYWTHQIKKINGKLDS